MYNNDEYLLLADFDSYVKAREEIQRRYGDRGQWAKSCLVNIAKSGYFSSDRTIQQYASEIWHITPVQMCRRDSAQSTLPFFNQTNLL